MKCKDSHLMTQSSTGFIVTLLETLENSIVSWNSRKSKSREGTQFYNTGVKMFTLLLKVSPPSSPLYLDSELRLTDIGQKRKVFTGFSWFFVSLILFLRKIINK